MRSSLHKLLVGFNWSLTRMSKHNSYYPPRLNLDENQDVDSLLKELNKVLAFLKAPEYSYMTKDRYAKDVKESI